MSPDLTRQIDRNTLEVMDRVWSADAVAKNASTSFYGNIVALAESPLAEGLIYAGTDDGRIWRTKNNGKKWTEIGEAPVPVTGEEGRAALAVAIEINNTIKEQREQLGI